MGEAGPVIVEFYGVPRLRSGRAEVTVSARTVAEALEAVEGQCPGLAGQLVANGRVAPHWLLCVEGRHFVSDLHQPLRPGDRLLLLSADAGG